MRIHKEGTASIALAALFVLFINLISKGFFCSSPWLITLNTFLSFLFFLFILQFFRRPNREIVQNEKYIIAPADGKVVVIEETLETEYFKDKRIQVSIFMSPLNVHINFSPIKGVVSYFKYHPGKFLVAWNPKSSTDNERTSIGIKNEKIEILVRQIAGFVARRICYYVSEGSKINQGEEFGFIKFGSRVDLFLPLDAKIKVDLEQKTIGGQTIIAEI